MQGRAILWLTAHVFSLSIWCVAAMGCSSPIPFSPSVELIQRVPVNTLTVNGHQMAYVDTGQGKPMILIHGFGGSMWQWEHQYIPFASSHRVIIPDLIGSGLSDKPEGTYSPQYLLQFFLAFMDGLRIQQATLVGNSMGAGLAMAMALDHPDRVDRLVLISGFPPQIETSIGSPEFRRFFEHRPPLWLAKIGNQLAGRSTTERLLKEMVYEPTLISAPVIERSFRNRQRGGMLTPLYSLLDHIDNWEESYGHRLDAITHRTLLLWGDHDRVFPVEIGQQVKNLIPKTQWHVISQAGHLPQWEQPEVVNALILSFLQEPS